MVMANDLDDLDETEGGPQPAEGRELVIIDLGHPTIMAHDRAAALAGVTRDRVYV